MFLADRDYYCLGLVVLLSLGMTTATPWGGVAVAGLAGLLGLLRWLNRRNQQFWWVNLSGLIPPVKVWGIAVGLALLATAYVYLRLPQPGVSDISRTLPRLAATADQTVQVVGRVTEVPLLNRSGKWHFLLAAERYQPQGTSSASQPVSGQVYTTIPVGVRATSKSCTNLLPGQRVQVTGRLYQPKSAGSGQFYQAFDFQKFLAGQGSFTGLAGQSCQVLQADSQWGLWMIRQRIATAQAHFLDSRAGPVLSGMVLGNRAVQVPFGVSDQFRRVGLSHALAASGFQVSLILTTVLALTKGRTQRQQLLWGGLALLAFGGLSGFAPSVLRAVLMGGVGLLALTQERQIKPVPVLLAVALVMLLFNPLWIDDLGFQFSFLATLGLMVSAKPIAQRFDWLPPRLADWLAVPLAAMLWVLPLQLAKFGVFPLYGLLVNLLVTPLLTVITVGGFISGLAALVWPLLGSMVAWLLTYPLLLLLGLVSWFSQLPGSSVAVGAISWGQMLLLYGLLVLLWRSAASQTSGLPPWTRQWQKQWPLFACLGLLVVLLPFWQSQTSNQRVTVLDHPTLPMLVVQTPGANIVLNSGAVTTAQGTSTFLATQGFNQIDWAIATNRSSRAQSGWLTLAKEVMIRRFSHVTTANSDAGYARLLAQLPASIQQQPFQVGEPLRLGTSQLTVLRAEPLALEMQLLGKRWLLLQDTRGNAGHEVWLASHPVPSVQVLWWLGRTLPPTLLTTLKPEVVILAKPPEPALIQQLQAQTIQWFVTERDGAVQWDGQRFIANLEPQ
jgi:competence protein ComEC